MSQTYKESLADLKIFHLFHLPPFSLENSDFPKVQKGAFFWKLLKERFTEHRQR